MYSMEIKRFSSFSEGLAEYNFYWDADFLEETTLLYVTRANEEENLFLSKNSKGEVILSSENTGAPVPISSVCIFSTTSFTFPIETFAEDILEILENNYPSKDLSFGIFSLTDSGNDVIDISYEDLSISRCILNINILLSKSLIRITSFFDLENLELLLFQIGDYIQEALSEN